MDFTINEDELLRLVQPQMEKIVDKLNDEYSRFVLKHRGKPSPIIIPLVEQFFSTRKVELSRESIPQLAEHFSAGIVDKPFSV